MPRSLEEIQQMYRRVHHYTLEKREISKLQKELMEEVKTYLSMHPEGFEVSLIDARDRSHNYHVSLQDNTRAVIDKDSIQHRLAQAGHKLDKKDITPGLIAEMVEQGIIGAEFIRDNEAVSSHKAVKRVKRPKRQQA